ncbi:hypothetical protein B0H13DRAFT_2264026 [Mycena leptocephala]|nr:hypothetical protein B0H13DRAFT_2264026 [Mycena leptocephala]
MDPVINLYYRLYKGQTPAPSKFPLQPSQSNVSVIDTNFIAPPYTVEKILRYILEREVVPNDGKAEVYIDRKDVKPAPPGTILDIEGPSTKSNAAIRVILPAVSPSQTTTTPSQTTTTPGQTSTAGQTTTTPSQTTTTPGQTNTAGQTTTTPSQITTTPSQTTTTPGPTNPAGQTTTIPGQTATSPSQTSNTNNSSGSSSNMGGAYTISGSHHSAREKWNLNAPPKKPAFQSLPTSPYCENYLASTGMDEIRPAHEIGKAEMRHTNLR